MTTMPPGNLIGGNLVTPDVASILSVTEIAPNLISATIGTVTAEQFEQFFVIGETDYTGAFTRAIAPNRRLVLARGKTYPARLSTFMDIYNFELDGNGATLTCDQTQSILGFKSLTWGISSNIRVHDLTIKFTNNPNVRIDNKFALWFEKVDGVTVERCIVPNSWSAGIIFSQCSNVKIEKNRVSGTLADGITCFGCGRNVTYLDNDFQNTADDAMAVTWLAGNTASDVGEATIKTKGVRLIGNRVWGTTVSARGVFIGGIEDGVIADNEFRDVSAFSILISDDTTVAKSSENVVIHDNTVINSGQLAGSLVGEVGGIAVYAKNLNIKVHDNVLKNSNNIALLLQGNVYADENLIDGVTNTPSAQNPSLPWLGAGIAWADFSGSNTCYGSSSRNQIRNTRHRPMWIQAGYNAEYLTLNDNEIHDCVDPVAVGTAAQGFIFLDSSARNQVVALRNKIFETRTTQVLQNGVYVGGGGLHDIDYVEINKASGGTQPNTPIANASGATSIKRFLQTTRDPGTIAANSSFSVTLSVADANLRDEVIITAPYQIPGLILNGFVQSANNVTMQLTNPTTAPIASLGSNTFTIRTRRQ